VEENNPYPPLLKSIHMSVEIKINNRLAKVELLEQNDNLLKVRVDDRIYDIDLMHTPGGTFSILESGHSYNIELIPQEQAKRYTAYTLYRTFDVEIIDAEARYVLNRGGGNMETGEKWIKSPMPGKVVRIDVSEGEAVTKGQTVLILSAMKMESEYKSPVDGLVRKIAVSAGEVVEGNQLLIEFE
jgi:biotin carboxyl carrier protein